MEERKQIKRPSFWHRPSSLRCSISWESWRKFPQRPFIFNKEPTNPVPGRDGGQRPPEWCTEGSCIVCGAPGGWILFHPCRNRKERFPSEGSIWPDMHIHPSSPRCAPITLALKPHSPDIHGAPASRWRVWLERVPKEKGDMRIVASLPQPRCRGGGGGHRKLTEFFQKHVWDSGQGMSARY